MISISSDTVVILELIRIDSSSFVNQTLDIAKSNIIA